MNKTSSWMSRQPALIPGPAGSVDQFTGPLRLAGCNPGYGHQILALGLNIFEPVNLKCYNRLFE